MKISLCNNFGFVCLLAALFFGCGETTESNTPTVDPPETGTATFSVTYDASDGTPMQVGYYLFDAAGKALPYTNVQGRSQTLRRIEDRTLTKASPISVGMPSEAAAGFTIVAVALPTGTTGGFTCNDNPGSLRDKMTTTPADAFGEYFMGRATLDQSGNAKLTLSRATGRLVVDLQGAQQALDVVASAEIVLPGNALAGGMRCDGTLIPLGSEAKISLLSDALSALVMPTVNERVDGGSVRVLYRLPGESDLHSAEMPLESQHGFTLLPNTQTKLTVTLQTSSNGEITPSLTVNTAWIDDVGQATDESDGTQSQFYHTFVRETVFQTNATDATNSAEAANATALALYDDYFYVPTGKWDFDLPGRKLVVDVWSISQKRKVGTISTPKPAEEGSFWFAVQTLHVSGNKLFVGHGVQDYPFGRPVARIDVYDLSVDPKAPSFLTSIGGDIYNPWQENPNADPDNEGKISEPFAVYEKQGKVLVLDNFRLSVFDSSDLTPGNSGAIKQTCFLSAEIGGSLNAADFFVHDSELYLTDPSREGSGGLRRVNWEAVMQNDGARLLDPVPAHLEGVPATKIAAADGGFLVFTDVESGTMSYYDRAWNFVTECNTYFANVTNGNYVNVKGKVTNAIPLPTPADRLPRLLMRYGRDVVIVRIERNYLTEF